MEKVFSYPGLGSLSFESAKYHDYNMLMVLSLLTGLVVVVFNMIAQIVDEKIDPRTAYERNVPDEPGPDPDRNDSGGEEAAA